MSNKRKRRCKSIEKFSCCSEKYFDSLDIITWILFSRKNIDITLSEFSVSPFLSTLSTIDFLYLKPSEWESELILVLDDISSKRNSEVESE
jgi:hypothetical protein